MIWAVVAEPGQGRSNAMRPHPSDRSTCAITDRGHHWQFPAIHPFPHRTTKSDYLTVSAAYLSYD